MPNPEIFLIFLSCRIPIFALKSVDLMLRPSDKMCKET